MPMLETALFAAVVAGVTTFLVDFALHWSVLVRLRRVEAELSDFSADLLSEKRRRAAVASVAARAGKATEFDAAIVKARTGVDLNQEEEPWWSSIAAGKQ